MLTNMSEIDPRAETPLVDWSALGVSGLLPTGTVTLLLADVEGSTRLWETQPGEMTAAVARLNETVSDIVVTHDGVRPVEQGEGDSFGNYAGPTINRTARLRDLGHGGQTLLSGATEQLVVDRLAAGVWLSDLGTHPLRDLPRPERVMQLCHPDLVNDFPPLREPKAVISQHLPAQLTSFVGRDAKLAQVRDLVAENRLVTLTGAGGVGKTRLAIQIAGQIANEFADGIWYVDLAPITDPDLVPTITARALSLPDQPGRSTMDTLAAQYRRDRAGAQAGVHPPTRRRRPRGRRRRSAPAWPATGGLVRGRHRDGDLAQRHRAGRARPCGRGDTDRCRAERLTSPSWCC
jgi:hypothetical protein